MEAVENARRYRGAAFHSVLDFMGRISDLALHCSGSGSCGKLVNSMRTARNFLGYFSLAPNAPFRQNPARAVNPVAVEESIQRDARGWGAPLPSLT